MGKTSTFAPGIGFKMLNPEANVKAQHGWLSCRNCTDHLTRSLLFGQSLVRSSMKLRALTCHCKSQTSMAMSRTCAAHCHCAAASGYLPLVAPGCKCSSHILAYEGDSTVRWYEGSYSEYEADLRRRSGNKEPTRLTFRKLDAATVAL